MSGLDTLLRGGDVLTPDGVHPLDIGLSGGKIAGLYAPGTGLMADEVRDCRGLTILPGLVDIHFHIRAPSYPQRGTVQTETRAAAAGGVTTLFEMPIAKPCCSNAAELERRRAHFAQNAFVNFGLYGAPGDLSREAIAAMQASGAIATLFCFSAFGVNAQDGVRNPDQKSTQGSDVTLDAIEVSAPSSDIPVKDATVS